MKLITLCSVLAIILTYLETRGKLKNGMLAGFILMTILAAIRYNYGTDYPVYLKFFQSIKQETFSLSRIFDNYYYRNDPGWVLLCFIFRPVGFFGMSAVISIVEGVIYYKFIRRYVPNKWWVFSVFMYLFLAYNLYIINMSMIRQGLAVALIVAMTPLIMEKKILPSLLLIAAIYTIHASALIFVPLLFIGFLPTGPKVSKVIAVFLGILFLLLLFSSSFLQDTFNSFMMIEDFSDYEQNYSKSAEAADGYGLGFVINLIPFVLSIYYLLNNHESTENQRRLAIIASLGTMVIPFSQILPLVTRIAIYFNAFSLVSFPFVYNIKNLLLKKILLGIYVLITVYSYLRFFQNSCYIDSFSDYHTIFSANGWV